MATNYYNVEMGVVDALGNLNVIYPVTTAANVAVGKNETLSDRLTSINSNMLTKWSASCLQSDQFFHGYKTFTGTGVQETVDNLTGRGDDIDYACFIMASVHASGSLPMGGNVDLKVSGEGTGNITIPMLTFTNGEVIAGSEYSGNGQTIFKYISNPTNDNASLSLYVNFGGSSKYTVNLSWNIGIFQFQ